MMNNKKSRLGKEFEEAVFRFAIRLDPHSKVFFDHSVPDRDTGEYRQCDVWIEAKYGSHWPINILVSCKDHKRKLHVGDIGSFLDEIRSTGANLGVIYSRNGFSGHALEKARVNGLICCRLYQHQPADVPDVIFLNLYLCSSLVRLNVIVDANDGFVNTWDDLFSCPYKDETILDVICNEIESAVGESVNNIKTTVSFPSDWSREIQISHSNLRLRIQIFGLWKKYKAKMDAILLNGSYCLKNELFQGSQFGPSIDTQGTYPGDGWEEVDSNITSLPSPKIITAIYDKEFHELLKKQFGPLPLF